MFIALALKLKQYNIFGRSLGKRGRSNFPDFYRLMVVLAYLKLGTFQTMPAAFSIGVTTARAWVEDFIYNVCNKIGPNGTTLYKEYVNFDDETLVNLSLGKNSKDFEDKIILEKLIEFKNKY